MSTKYLAALPQHRVWVRHWICCSYTMVKYKTVGVWGLEGLRWLKNIAAWWFDAICPRVSPCHIWIEMQWGKKWRVLWLIDVNRSGSKSALEDKKLQRQLKRHNDQGGPGTHLKAKTFELASQLCSWMYCSPRDSNRKRKHDSEIYGLTLKIVINAIFQAIAQSSLLIPTLNSGLGLWT